MQCHVYSINDIFNNCDEFNVENFLIPPVDYIGYIPDDKSYRCVLPRVIRHISTNLNSTSFNNCIWYRKFNKSSRILLLIMSFKSMQIAD